jgi:hypothetical protein
MTAAAKKTRTASVGGAEHTDASLEAMKTGEIATLIASITGGKPPKPATKAKAIELFWKEAQGLPKAPEVPDSKADALEATTEAQGAEKGAPVSSRPKRSGTRRSSGGWARNSTGVPGVGTAMYPKPVAVTGHLP